MGAAPGGPMRRVLATRPPRRMIPRRHFLSRSWRLARCLLAHTRTDRGHRGGATMRMCLGALAAALLLAGCAASGPTGSEVLTGSIKPGTSRVVMYRTSAFGLAIQPDYLIDGQKVGMSQPNGFVVC